MTCLFVEHLTVIDCAYLDARRGLVGESWIVDLELEGDLDAQSMVLDFGEVKKRLKRAIDASVDHTLIVPAQSPKLQLGGAGQLSSLYFDCASAGAIEHHAPIDAITLLDAETVSVEALEAHLSARLTDGAPPNISAMRVRLRTEAIDGAFYHYTHGLKKHAGQCQRIAHGHRSRIEVRVDGKRDAAVENDVAERWRDIYLGTRDDLVSQSNDRMRFDYVAAEGRFTLELPSVCCDLLHTDSTVERIAEHLAARIGSQTPCAVIEVRAYEGVMKGAIARSGP